MKRRMAFQWLAMAAAGLVLPYRGAANIYNQKGYIPRRKSIFSMDGTNVRFLHPDITQSVRLTLIADTHLFRDDDRGRPFASYSGRMAKAYNRTRHFQTSADLDPERAFEETLRIAKEQQSDLLVLAGDIFSFPSEAAVEWVLEKLQRCGLPYVYTAGNHDWHYEGMEGTVEALRATWTDKRLKPLYQGRDPLMQRIDLGALQLIVLDNSTYEISPVQLEFFRDCLKASKPSLLVVHIPLYAPGRPVGFGCGHPQWGAQSDKSYSLERRPRWPEGGHSKTTRAFYEEVLSAHTLMGVLAGHIHNPSVDVMSGLPQIVAEANAEGGFLQVTVSGLSA